MREVSCKATRPLLDAVEGEAAAPGAASSPELRSALASAVEGTERVLLIVRDLKTFSRLHDESADTVDARSLLDSTLALAEHVVGAKARIVRDYAPIPPVRAARGKLGQVFLNLLTNAADAIPEGSPAAELGGRIELDSAPGATTFRVMLPAAPADARALANGAARDVPPSAPPRRRVLVVDDEPALLSAIRILLQDEHDVVTASGTREALAILDDDSRFDAVLADLMMADLTGNGPLRRGPRAPPAH